MDMDMDMKVDATPSPSLAEPHLKSTAAPASGPRLLYRGALALPDSHLLLDGISFTLHLNLHPNLTTTGEAALMENTLALTLESLRGRHLHLIDTVRVRDLWLAPPPADIDIDVHPEATLTRLFFENVFCLCPVSSPDGRTEYGVRVSLTDNNDPATPDLLIYGALQPSEPPLSHPASPAAPSSPPPRTLRLLAACILPAPPPAPARRLPRPDDPTPRRPPRARARGLGGAGAGAGAAGAAGAKRKREASDGEVEVDVDDIGDEYGDRDVFGGGSGGGSGLRRAGSSSTTTTGDGPGTSNGNGKGTGKGKAKAKARAAGAGAREEEMRVRAGGGAVAALGKDARVGAGRAAFKVPSVPVRGGLEGGGAGGVGGVGSGSGRGKEKEKDSRKGKGGGGGGVERENKDAVKRAVVRALEREGVGRMHAEFAELFQTVYHGACFALRRRLGVDTLAGPTIERFVDAHVRMYVSGEVPGPGQ